MAAPVRQTSTGPGVSSPSLASPFAPQRAPGMTTQMPVQPPHINSFMPPGPRRSCGSFVPAGSGLSPRGMPMNSMVSGPPPRFKSGLKGYGAAPPPVSNLARMVASDSQRSLGQRTDSMSSLHSVTSTSMHSSNQRAFAAPPAVASPRPSSVVIPIPTVSPRVVISPHRSREASPATALREAPEAPEAPAAALASLLAATRPITASKVLSPGRKAQANNLSTDLEPVQRSGVSPPRSPRCKKQSRCEQLYQDSVERKQRYESIQDESQRTKRNSLEDARRDALLAQRERQRSYRFRDTRTHEQRESEVLQRREARRSRVSYKKRMEEQELQECTFQPTIFTRPQSRPQSTGRSRPEKPTWIGAPDDARKLHRLLASQRRLIQQFAEIDSELERFQNGRDRQMDLWLYKQNLDVVHSLDLLDVQVLELTQQDLEALLAMGYRLGLGERGRRGIASPREASKKAFEESPRNTLRNSLNRVDSSWMRDDYNRRQVFGQPEIVDLSTDESFHL